MNNHNLDYKPKTYFEKDIKNKTLLDVDAEEDGVTIAVIETGCALPFSCFTYMIASYSSGKYEYKLITEYEEIKYKIKHNESNEPLTMKEVIENIDTAILVEEGSTTYDELPVGIIHSFLSKTFESEVNIEEIMKRIQVDSYFYPIKEYYEEQKNLWLQYFYNDEKELIFQKYNEAKSILIDDFEKRITNATPDICKDLMISNSNKKFTEIFKRGETKYIEFKESLSLDVRQMQNNKSYQPKKENYIELAVLKTIAGFLNSDGGQLFIGVNDQGEVLGIQEELDILHKSSKDKIQLHLKNLIKENIGSSFNNFYNAELIKEGAKEIIHIFCEKSDKEVFIKGKDFYVRSGPSTDKLEGRELLNYTKSRFD